MKKSVFEIATERIVTLLESGTNPWRKTWSASTTIPPMNYASKRVYSGINFFLLSMLENPFFMTYKQIEKAGGHLKKGAKSEIVFYWLWTYYYANGKITKNENEAVKKIPNLRYYRVFNAPDIEGIEFEYPEHPQLKPNEKYDNCEQLIKSTNAAIEHINSNQPYYNFIKDFINMPVIGSFDNSDFYYATLFHELGHWTGAKQRLNRELPNRYADEKYSKEELIAEMTSAFLCAEMGIDNNDLTDNSAAYLQGWINALKGDSKLIITAASAAQKAFNSIISNYKKEATVTLLQKNSLSLLKV
ncbi:zincin-like metallopeptidase domain-containing protein [Saprospiraceae bacterium]|jgi:antirestriction protein ArdC|nr:zincin-like metallopeptidase domain-containing protein [Saprospiraceae bacterium]